MQIGQIPELEQSIRIEQREVAFASSCQEIYKTRGGKKNSYLDSLAEFMESNDPQDLRNGYRYEILFHACISLHNPYFRLLVTNRNQDLHGEDFHIDGLPLDVTANLCFQKMAEDSCREANYCILFLPPCSSYTEPFTQNSQLFTGDNLYYKLFLNGKMDIQAFLKHIYTINILILEDMIKYKQIFNNPEVSGNLIKRCVLEGRFGKVLVEKISTTDVFVFDQKIKEVNRIFRIIDPSIPPPIEQTPSP